MIINYVLLAISIINLSILIGILFRNLVYRFTSEMISSLFYLASLLPLFIIIWLFKTVDVDKYKLYLVLIVTVHTITSFTFFYYITFFNMKFKVEYAKDNDEVLIFIVLRTLNTLIFLTNMCVIIYLVKTSLM